MSNRSNIFWFCWAVLWGSLTFAYTCTGDVTVWLGLLLVAVHAFTAGVRGIWLIEGGRSQ